jgi:DNA mismatch endonuclease (patch repair protein)
MKRTRGTTSLTPSPLATSEATRHTMQANRSKNTAPELMLRALLREAGYPGYRIHWKGAPGHPDVAYPGRRIAIFVNGCYWHRCPHCDPPTPKRNAEFWTAKFLANEDRDTRQTAMLEGDGWTVLTIWECEIKREPRTALARILDALHKADS